MNINMFLDCGTKPEFLEKTCEHGNSTQRRLSWDSNQNIVTVRECQPLHHRASPVHKLKPRNKGFFYVISSFTYKRTHFQLYLSSEVATATYIFKIRSSSWSYTIVNSGTLEFLALILKSQAVAQLIPLTSTHVFISVCSSHFHPPSVFLKYPLFPKKKWFIWPKASRRWLSLTSTLFQTHTLMRPFIVSSHRLMTDTRLHHHLSHEHTKPHSTTAEAAGRVVPDRVLLQDKRFLYFKVKIIWGFFYKIKIFLLLND